jgi:hypothetical protein
MVIIPKSVTNGWMISVLKILLNEYDKGVRLIENSLTD